MHDEDLRVCVDAGMCVADTQRKARRPAKARIPFEAATGEVGTQE